MSQNKQKMIATTVYIPVATKRKLAQAARRSKCRESELHRDALLEGLDRIENRQRRSIEGMRELTEFAKKNSSNAPADLSTHLDKYLWDE